MSELKVNTISNAAGTNAISIDGSGNVTLAQNLAATTMSGDLTLGANGVYLGGTGAANYLDDYEEGTFTPTFSDSSNVSSFSLLHARYIKVGKQVFCVVYVTANIASSTAGTYFSVEVPFARGGNFTIMGSGSCDGGDTVGAGAIYSSSSSKVYITFGALGLGLTGTQTFHLAVQYESS